MSAASVVVHDVFAKYSCPGVFRGSIGYLPGTAPSEANVGPGRDGWTTVGQFMFVMP